MTIPQVNALATDRNRKQTKRIVELVGLRLGSIIDGIPQDVMRNFEPPLKLPGGITRYCEDVCSLPNGSFTLCQVVGMLEAEGVIWEQSVGGRAGGWWTFEDGGTICECLVATDMPHDLTAAMDALIKVLETKGEKE